MNGTVPSVVPPADAKQDYHGSLTWVVQCGVPVRICHTLGILSKEVTESTRGKSIERKLINDKGV